METPVALLKIAMYETDVVQRTNRAIKACRIITDIIPFDKRNQALLEEPDIMKYLMLCAPLNPGSITIIINTMIEKFKKLPHFIKYMFAGFEFIAQIEERNEKLQKAKGAAIKLLQLGVQKLLKVRNLKDENGLAKDGLRMDYCDEITSNKELIKLKSIEYLEKIIKIYFKEKYPEYPFTPDIQGLLKKYISCTTSIQLIENARKIVDVVKNLDTDKEFEIKIDEFANKRLSYIENPNTPKNDSQNPAPLLRSFSSVKEALMKGLAMQRDQNKDSAPHSQTSMDEEKKKAEAARRNKGIRAKTEIHLKKGTILEESDSGSVTEASLSQEKAVLESLKDEKINNLEEWLSDNMPHEVPLLSKNETANTLLKENDNYESLITFILDPMMYSVSAGWAIRHSFLDEVSLLDDNNPLTETKKSVQMNILRNEPRYQTYMYRSHKAVQALCDLKNFRSMIGANHHIIENYFSMIYVCLNRNDAVCNYNHLAKVAEFYLKREPTISITFITHYNLMFKWLQGVEYEYIQKLLISLFNCSDEFTPLMNLDYQKFIKYISTTGFFLEVTNAILFGEKGLDLKKFDSQYKAPGADKLWNIEEDYEISEIKEERTYKSHEQSNGGRRSSTLNFEENDIDLIMDVFRNGLKLNIDLVNERKKNIAPPEKSPQRKALELRYPSVIQKMLAEEEKHERTHSSLSYVGEKSNPDEKDKRKGSKITASPNLNSPVSNTALTQMTEFANISKIAGGSINGSRKLMPLSPVASIGNLKLPAGNNANTSKSNVDETVDSKRDHNNSSMTENGPKSKRRGSDKLSILPNEPSQFKPKDIFPKTTKAGDPTLPKARTILNEFDKEVMGKQEMKMISSLYPYSTRNTVETEMDKDSKKPDYSVSSIRANDAYSIALCEMLDIMFRKTLVADSPIREKIGLKTKVDHTLFWDSFFADGKAFAFDRLVKNYLLKIKIHHIEQVNSGFMCGQLVNLILKHAAQEHKFFTKYRRVMCDVSRNYFNFLCKAIIHSHAWAQRADANNVYLQTYKVKDPLGTARIMLVETMTYMILNDSVNNYGLLHEVNDTTWHTLVVWFFDKKTNEIYQRIFFTLIEATLKHSNEKLCLTLLLKLNLASNLYKTWYEVCQNNVFLRDQQIDSMLFSIKRFVKLINEVLETKEYNTLKEQLNASHSWQDMKKKFIQTAPQKKKKTMQVDTKTHMLSPPTADEKSASARRIHKSMTHAENVSPLGKPKKSEFMNNS